MEFPFNLYTNGGIDPETGGVVKIPVTGLVKADVTIRKYDDPLTVYDYDAITELEDGEYVMTGILFPFKPCRIYINDVSQLWLGIVFLGELSTVYAAFAANNAFTGINTFAGTTGYTTEKTLSDAKEFTHKSYVDTGLAGCMTLATNQNVNSQKIFLQNITVPTATENRHAVPLSQLNSAIAGVAVSPHQVSSQHRRVITDGATETGKVYTTIASAIASLSPSSAKRCAVEIEGTGTSGKILLSHLSMVDYVDIIGKRKFNLVLGTSGATLTKTMTFKNLNIYMGNCDIVGARTYTNVTFEDCNIYAFNDLTLTNCILTNTKVYQGSGHNVTPTGNCEFIGGGFTQPLITAEEMTGFIASDDNLSPSYSMPADPTDTGS